MTMTSGVETAKTRLISSHVNFLSHTSQCQQIMASILSLTDFQSSMASSESRNIRTSSVPLSQHTYVKRAVRKAHFKLNRAFKVIPDHHCWCRQESRTVWS